MINSVSQTLFLVLDFEIKETEIAERIKSKVAL